MKLQPLMTMTGRTGAPVDIGNTRKGSRQVFDAAGGEFSGDRLNGKLTESGGEWLLVDAEGFGHVDARVVLKTEDGASIYMQYTGVMELSERVMKAATGEIRMDFGDIFFVTQPRFETGDPRYRWLNNLIAVAEARIIEGAVQYRVFEVVPSP